MLIFFNEGKDYILEQGWPQTTFLLLSRRGVSAGDRFAVDDSIGQSGEIHGTGYVRQSLPRPQAVNSVLSFGQVAWLTELAMDWPQNVRSLVAVTARDERAVMLCAWDLQETGEPRDMSHPDTTEQVSPIFAL